MFWVIIVSFSVGSFPTAFVIGRLLGRPDIRSPGDGNVGSQNVARSYGFKFGLIVFALDALKGSAAVVMASSLLGTKAGILAGTACVLGHSWSIFLHFRGGRGEATAIGVLTTLIPLPMVIAGICSIGTLIWTKNVIMASVVLFVPLIPLCMLTGVSRQLTIYSIALPVILGLIFLIKERQKMTASISETCPQPQEEKTTGSDLQHGSAP